MNRDNLINAIKEGIKGLCFECGANLEEETLQENAEAFEKIIRPVIEFEVKQGGFDF